MKKHKALEDMTHQDIVEALVNDDNIADNLYVSNDYPPDKFGNNLVTLGFDEPNITKKKKLLSGFILFTFNPNGRLVSLEVAVRKGNKDWEIASSDKLVDFTARFGTDIIKVSKKGKKSGI